ncbi:hypothetical protein E4U60_001017 [Claviceps pazoutovae]|uniref:Uncharacterized protein n=1 Tax=Claviceps pazoutovae TaxID=1649127 RepID=A0A9P7MCX6_9HYPO|nr:hypothetical protein E4U60_001017 [Claviceps pazoutovae]
MAVMSTWTASSSPFWTRRRRMLRNSCISVLVSVVVIFFFTAVTIQLAVQSHDSKHMTLEPRQFQLGGLFGGDSIQMKIDPTGKSASLQSAPILTSSSNNYVPGATLVANVDDAPLSASVPTAPISNTVMQEHVHQTNTGSPHVTKAANGLLLALVKALHLVLGNQTLKGTANVEPNLRLTITDALPTAPGKSINFPTSSSTSSGAHHKWERSSTAVVLSETQQRHVPQFSPDIEAPGQLKQDVSHQNTELALSLLSHMCILVNHVAATSLDLAAQLTDATLAALPVDATAVSSVISTLAENNSTSLESTIPLILPAVAIAFGRRIDISAEEPVNTAAQNLAKTYETIVTEGSYIINQIVAASFVAETPLMGEVLSQVVGILHDASTKLNLTMCALKLDGRELPWEVVLPCASINLKPVASVTDLRPHPTGSQRPLAMAAMAGMTDFPVASAEAKTVLSDIVPHHPHLEPCTGSRAMPSLRGRVLILYDERDYQVYY